MPSEEPRQGAVTLPSMACRRTLCKYNLLEHLIHDETGGSTPVERAQDALADQLLRELTVALGLIPADRGELAETGASGGQRVVPCQLIVCDIGTRWKSRMSKPVPSISKVQTHIVLCGKTLKDIKYLSIQSFVSITKNASR